METKSDLILKEYLETRSVSPTTRRLYRQALETLETFTQVTLDKIDRETLATWYKQISKEAKPGTIVKYGTNLRIMYTHILEGDGLDKREAESQAKALFDVIPFKDLRKTEKKQDKLRDKLVTPTEFQQLMNGTSSIRTKALIAVTYESGCRKGEIFSLRLKDIIQRENHWALRVTGKTGVRTVPIVNSIPYLKAWLQYHPAAKDENQHLFVNDRGGIIKPLHPQGFNSTLSKLSNKLNIRRIYPHMLRHTRLTRLAEDGLGEFQMKSFAGWTADSNMAAKYIHLTGTSHLNAVLETQGVHTEEGEEKILKPFIKLEKCPSCGKEIDSSMIVCPYCELVLRERVGISQEEKMKELESRVESLQDMLIGVLNNPDKLDKARKQLGLE